MWNFSLFAWFKYASHDHTQNEFKRKEKAIGYFYDLPEIRVKIE